MILIPSSSRVQGNLIMLILLCSYLLSNSSWCVPLVLVGFRDPEPSPHPQSWDRPDGICRVRQDMKDK